MNVAVDSARNGEVKREDPVDGTCDGGCVNSKLDLRKVLLAASR